MCPERRGLISSLRWQAKGFRPRYPEWISSPSHSCSSQCAKAVHCTLKARSRGDYLSIWSSFSELGRSGPHKSYRPVEVTCSAISDESPSLRRTAVSAFSGGVDATFAMLYHTDGVAKVDRVKVNAAVLVHGFDIALDQTKLSRSRRATLEQRRSSGRSTKYRQNQLRKPGTLSVRTDAFAAGLRGLPSPVRGMRHSCHGHRRGLRAFRAPLGLQSGH